MTTPPPSSLRRILAATDLSPVSLLAVQRAADLAAACSAELIVLHACASELDPHLASLQEQAQRRVLDQAEKELQQAMSAVNAPIPHVVRVVSGNAIDVILQEVVTARPDLLVAGTHGRTGLDHLALGSVAEHLAQNAPVDVLMVRNAPQGKYRHVLLAMKQAATAALLAERALLLARRYLLEPKLHVVSVYEIPVPWHSTSVPFEKLRASARENQENAVRPALEDLRRAGIAVEARFVEGRAATEILKAAQQIDCDLLMVGSHNRPRWTNMLLGDTSRPLAHKAKCDLWLAREPRAAHPLRDAILRELALK